MTVIWSLEEYAEKLISFVRPGISTMSTKTEIYEGEITLSHLFAVPREIVFRAFTVPTLLAQWWGPKGYINPVCELDPRPQGEILIHMTAPDGTSNRLTGQFISIRTDEIVFTMDARDIAGAVLLESRTTIELEDLGTDTNLTLNTVAVGRVPIAVQMIEGMESGWMQSFDRLGELLMLMK